MRWLWASSAMFGCMAMASAASLRIPLPRALSRPHDNAASASRDQSSQSAETPLDAAAPCPEQSAPDHGICVQLTSSFDQGPSLAATPSSHRNRAGSWTAYDQIPLLPERPKDYDAYRYPVLPGLPNGHSVASGYDLDQPDEAQRRGPRLRHVGHGGVDLPQAKGAVVRYVALEHQEGDAEVLFTGRLFGTTVVARASVREADRLREYVVLFGHLDSIAPSMAPGTMLNDGETVGAVGETGSPGFVHLHYEVRRVREDVDLRRVPSGPQLIAESTSTVCDPRNVLPLKTR